MKTRKGTRAKEDEMTSAAKIEANRLNALKSTGPRSRLGKMRSARNAEKHGLTSKANPKEIVTILYDVLANDTARQDFTLPDNVTSDALHLAIAEAHLNEVYRIELDLLTKNLAHFAASNDLEADLNSGIKMPEDFRLIHRYIYEAECKHLKAINKWCRNFPLKSRNEAK